MESEPTENTPKEPTKLVPWAYYTGIYSTALIIIILLCKTASGLF